jgi:hypothetical protein
MVIPAVFGLSILLSFVAFGLVTRFFIWPWLLVTPRDDALLPLVVPHTTRFIGLSFLVPGVVSPALPPAFAAPAAYGDLVATLLAIAASGAADFLLAYYQGLVTVQLDASMLGAAYFIPTVFVPAALITHGLIFWLLIRPDTSG